MGWGGQRLVPDEIWVLEGITPYDEAEYPWGYGFTDYDIAALEDGTVYVITMDAWNHGLSSGPTDPDRKTPYYRYIVIKKYDPGSDSWSQVATVNINTPTEAYSTNANSCELGPDGFIYFSWWEVDEYNVGGDPNVVQWKWHLIKFDPSSDTYVELGTGQNAVTVDSTDVTDNYTEDTLANHILPMASGDIYVATIEEKFFPGGPGNPHGDGYFHTCVVWRWNGSSWSNLNLPSPSFLGDGDYYEVNGENSFYDRVPTMVAARHGEGPVTNGFTLHYPYTYMGSAPPLYFDERQGVTISYTEGSGWHDEILTDWTTLIHASLDDGQVPDDDFAPRRTIAFSVDILWSEKLGKLILVTDFVGGGSGAPWWIWGMNAAGSAWEPLKMHHRRWPSPGGRAATHQILAQTATCTDMDFPNGMPPSPSFHVWGSTLRAMAA